MKELATHSAPIRVATFTTLYPNELQTRHGIFTEQRQRRLVESGQAEVRVIAPIPSFPLSETITGYKELVHIPSYERRFDIDIAHPRYRVIPKVGMLLQPLSLARCGLRAFEELSASGYHADIIDAHYFYPDGVAAVWLGRRLGIPVMVTALGSDINLIAKYRIPRKMIKWAALNCSRAVTVSQALKDELIRIGVPETHIDVLRNAVDLEMFSPLNKQECRRQIGVTGQVLLSVGLLDRKKGHDLAIKALQSLPKAQLIIVGEGPDEQRLQRLTQTSGLEERVHFVKTVPQEQLSAYYSAADVLVLASEREGMPHVVLEALACGTPAVATAVGGVPEIIVAPEAGVMVYQRTAAAIADGVDRLIGRSLRREDTRRLAESFGWPTVTAKQLRLYSEIIAAREVP